MVMSLHEKVAKRFYSRVIKTDSCWIWKGTIGTDGYGSLYDENSRQEKAHRISYRLNKGEIPKGLCVMHKCDNKLCVNPEHLSLGTRKENNLDRVKKGRTKDGMDLPRTKLSDTDIYSIFSLFFNHKTPQKLIAKYFDIDQGHISTILGKRRQTSRLKRIKEKFWKDKKNMLL